MRKRRTHVVVVVAASLSVAGCRPAPEPASQQVESVELRCVYQYKQSYDPTANNVTPSQVIGDYLLIDTASRTVQSCRLVGGSIGCDTVTVQQDSIDAGLLPDSYVLMTLTSGDAASAAERLIVRLAGQRRSLAAGPLASWQFSTAEFSGATLTSGGGYCDRLF